jgi:16S rRNA (adenine1518-N6/adenine1519-N6)-dimethyltransferase
MSQHIRPRKRFGQHFLVDPGALQQIVAAINPQPDELLIEIGPGQGALTRCLLSAGVHCEAVEFDRDLVAYLEAQAWPRLKVHQADALTVDFSALVGYQTVRCVGNLPYNISTPILFHCLAHKDVIHSMCFLLQKEVVDRLSAVPGCKAYGRLSVMVQYHCDVHAVCIIGPEAFDPPPKVDSAVVILNVRPPKVVAEDPAHLAALVQKAFQMRRKTLRNALKALVSDAVWSMLDIDSGLRAEALSVDDFVRLSNALQCLS